MSESRVPFTGFDPKTAKFYTRLLVNVMMNAHAVRMGYFDVYLCETDDPNVSARWLEARNDIAGLIRRKNTEANKPEEQA